MRRLIGLSILAASAAIAAQPACAADAPQPLYAQLVAGAFAPFATGTAALTAATPGPAITDYRLHALIEAAPAKRVALDDQASRLRRGFGGTMVDFFPAGGDGFHISGGSRFYSRGPARAGTVDARGLVDMRYATLLAAPRSMIARASRRMTPALTFGYTKLIQGGMSLGVEGGAMLGRFDTLAGSLVRAPRLRGEGLADGAGQFNQITRLTFGYRF